jgi:hypothetical protein
VFHTADKGRSEGIRVGDPSRHVTAPMALIILPEPVDARVPPFRVQLRGIFAVGDTASVRLLGYPAFVPDVGVAVGGVQRRDDAPCFRARAISHRQPRAGGSMLLDVFGRRINAHIRQPGALEVESAKLFAVHLEWALVPVAFDSLPRLSRLFASALGVVKDLASRRFHRLSGLGNLTRRIGSVNNTRIRFQAVARAHIGIMPSFRNQPTSVRKNSISGFPLMRSAAES